MDLANEDKLFLFKVVRDVIYCKLIHTDFPVYYKSKNIYKEKIGVFIKVMQKDLLRAYGGVLEPDKGLLENVRDITENACFYDPRFLPLKADELDKITIQLAVIESINEIQDKNLIKPDAHGLSVESGGKRGVILPWDMKDFQLNKVNIEQYINDLALKAGIDNVSGNIKLKLIKIITFSETDF